MLEIYFNFIEFCQSYIVLQKY